MVSGEINVFPAFIIVLVRLKPELQHCVIAVRAVHTVLWSLVLHLLPEIASLWRKTGKSVFGTLLSAACDKQTGCVHRDAADFNPTSCSWKLLNVCFLHAALTESGVYTVWPLFQGGSTNRHRRSCLWKDIQPIRARKHVA